MRKGLLCVLLLLAGAFCACKPTPESEVVTNKGDEVLERKIAEAQEREMQVPEVQLSSVPTPSPTPYSVPEDWQLEIELPNFLVRIDATIEMPSGPYPVIRLSQNCFSEMGDILSSLLEQIIPSPVGKRKGIDSYEDYVHMLELYALGRYDSDSRTYVPYSTEEQKEVEKEMKELSYFMQTALHRGEYDEDETFITEVDTTYTYVTEDGKEWYVLIGEDYFSISSNPSFYPYRESNFLGYKVSPTAPDPTPYPNVLISEEQALAIAQEVLDAIPQFQWEPIEAERAGLLRTPRDPLTEEATTTQGYLLTFTRKIGNTTFFNYKEGGSGRLHFDDTPYAASLEFEELQIFVDENGVQLITWLNPIVVEETVTNSIEIMSFADIQNIFVQTMKNGLRWAEEHPTSNGELNPTRIGRVQKSVLAYAYIQEKDNVDKYLAVPTWFFTYRTSESDNIVPVYIAINAVDGTRIAY